MDDDVGKDGDREGEAHLVHPIEELTIDLLARRWIDGGQTALRQLRDRGVAVIGVDPGFTRTELVDLMGERGMVDPGAAVPMDVPVKTIVHVVTSDDPMAYTGTILRAAEFVRENGL